MLQCCIDKYPQLGEPKTDSDICNQNNIKLNNVRTTPQTDRIGVFYKKKKMFEW